MEEAITVWSVKDLFIMYIRTVLWKEHKEVSLCDK